MTAGLAVALIAEHLTAGTPLKELVDRLGVNDRSEVAAAALEVQGCAVALRDLVAPVGTRMSPSAGGSQKGDGAVVQRNRYKGTCRCGRFVAEGHGRAVKRDGRWAVECRVCTGEGST